MKRRVLTGLGVVLVLAATAAVVWANGGLVGYWPFDEGSGTTAHDALNANHGTIYGATYTTDKAPIVGNDYALAFNRAELDYVQVPDSATLEPANVTVAAWVKSSNPGSYGYVIAKGANACSAASYAIYPGGSAGLFFYIKPNGGSYTLSPNGGSSVWDDTWHHVAGTYDGNTVRLYVDGAEIGVGTSTTAGIDYVESTNGFLLVGAYGGTCNYHFDGLIDEVGVWNRALSAEEIAFLASPDVSIDIKPGSDPNCINPDGHGVIPVAILTTDTFDAATVDPFSVTLEGSTVRVKGKSGNAGSLEDVDGDGDLDLVLQIMDDTLLGGKDTALLEGLTFGGLPIRGSDSICIVP